MADTVSYARDAHHVIGEVVAKHRSGDSNGSTFAFVHVPADAWSALVALAKRPAPELAQVKPCAQASVRLPW